MAKKKDPVASARESLRAAIDRACLARGEAMWSQGYRAAVGARGVSGEQYDRLYEKEQAQFAYCSVAERTAERRMREFARAVALASNSRKRSAR